MVYVLEGEITLIEGDTETVLRPGDAATFQAGVPIGHFLENRSAKATRCLVVGTRAAVDTITYPDLDQIVTATDRSQKISGLTAREKHDHPNEGLKILHKVPN